MKKAMIALMAAALLTASVPGFALAHGVAHDPADVECARDCELMLKNCSQDVLTIQQKISRLESAIKKDGANPERVAEVKVLQQKLDDATELLRSMERAGH